MGLSKTLALSDLVLHVKRDSSVWLKSCGPEFAEFHWQDGYGAFTIGHSQIEDLKRYIANQKEHHRKRSFKEELVAFLEKYEVDYDKRFVFS